MTEEVLVGLQDAATDVADAVQRRDALIVAAHRSGTSLRTIAACVTLSHTGVAEIIRRCDPVPIETVREQLSTFGRRVATGRTRSIDPARGRRG